MNKDGKPVVWLLKEHEHLPLNDRARLMRTGMTARALTRKGVEVIWFASRFDHSRKSFHLENSPVVTEDGFTIHLLPGKGYQRNISLRRIRHHQLSAASFLSFARRLPLPDLILASYPSPEFCDVGRSFAKKHNIPFAVDIRDPWPDMFSRYFPPGVRLALLPIIAYYRRILSRVVNDSDLLMASTKSMLDWGLKFGSCSASKRERVFYLGAPGDAVMTENRTPSRFTKEEPLRCLFVATFGKTYAGDLLVDTAKELTQRGEERVTFEMVGDGELKSYWEERAKGLPNMKFLGWKSESEMEECLIRSHVGLLAIAEGASEFWIGNKFFDYLRAGLLVVNIGGNKELRSMIESSKLGVSCNNSASELSGLISKMADQPQIVADFMANSVRSFIQDYSENVVYERLSEELLQLVSSKRSNLKTPRIVNS